MTFEINTGVEKLRMGKLYTERTIALLATVLVVQVLRYAFDLCASGCVALAAAMHQ